MRREELFEGISVLLGWCLTFGLFAAVNYGMWGWVCWFGVIGSPVITFTYLLRWNTRFRPYTILNYQPICAECVVGPFVGYECRCGDPQGTIDYYAAQGRDIMADMRMFARNLPPGV